MKIFYSLIIIFLLISCNDEIKVELTQRSTLDTDFSSIQPRWEKIPEYINLSNLKIDTSKATFGDINGKIFGKQISYIVVNEKDKDLLYIDLNGDSLLTDDNNPYSFPKTDSSFTFRIDSSGNDLIYIDILFLRKKASYQDKDGNLKDFIVPTFQGKFPEFTGKKGTYYFLDVKGLSVGKLEIDDKIYKIALFETTGNGLFNDFKSNSVFGGDLLLIDLNQDNKLSFMYEGEVFHLDEVFAVNNRNYKLNKIDPYGRFLSVVETNEPVSARYLNSRTKNHDKRSKMVDLTAEFFNSSFSTIDNSIINIPDYKGKYLLLNFWGEWCQPCLAELPEIIYTFSHYEKEKLEIISFIKYMDLDKARKIIDKYQIEWPQIEYNSELQKMFDVRSYPTNILISPDKKAIRIVGPVNRLFFEKYIK